MLGLFCTLSLSSSGHWMSWAKGYFTFCLEILVSCLCLCICLCHRPLFLADLKSWLINTNLCLSPFLNRDTHIWQIAVEDPCCVWGGEGSDAVLGTSSRWKPGLQPVGRLCWYTPGGGGRNKTKIFLFQILPQRMYQLEARKRVLVLLIAFLAPSNTWTPKRPIFYTF